MNITGTGNDQSSRKNGMWFAGSRVIESSLIWNNSHTWGHFSGISSETTLLMIIIPQVTNFNHWRHLEYWSLALLSVCMHSFWYSLKWASTQKIKILIERWCCPNTFELCTCSLENKLNTAWSQLWQYKGRKEFEVWIRLQNKYNLESFTGTKTCHWMGLGGLDKKAKAVYQHFTCKEWNETDPIKQKLKPTALLYPCNLIASTLLLVYLCQLL